MTGGTGIGARRRQWIDAGPRPPVAERFAAAQTFAEFLESAQALREFWNASARRASGDPALVERVIATGRNWRLLVLTADWCGDSVNTVPYRTLPATHVLLPGARRKKLRRWGPVAAPVVRHVGCHAFPGSHGPCHVRRRTEVRAGYREGGGSRSNFASATIRHLPRAPREQLRNDWEGVRHADGHRAAVRAIRRRPDV